MSNSRTKKSIYNMSASLTNSIVLLTLRFLSRRYFLISFGTTILGFNSTFNNLLGMLNLAEMGIGIAISYKMYKPVADNNYDVINGYLSIYRKLYRYIGLIILAIGLLIIPIIPLLVKEEYVKIGFLGIIFFIQLLSVTSTYWLSYSRILFNVYQDSYYTSFIDMFVTVIITILQILDMVFLKNYYLFLFLLVLQVLLSNVIVLIISKKKYSFLSIGGKKNKNIFKFCDIKNDIKNVLFAKIGGYILNCTDAIIVSVVLGATATGYMTNYSTIYISFQTIILTMLGTVQPSLGNKVVSECKKSYIEKVIFNLTFVAQLIGCLFSVISFFIIEDFIVLWITDKYILSSLIAGFFSINVYIYILMNPIFLIFGALGYYKYDKWAVMISAIINIFISVFLVYQCGIVGVLIGTTVALSIYWITRVIILYSKYYMYSSKKYIILIVKCFIATLISLYSIYYVNSLFNMNNCIQTLVIKCFIYICIIISINFIVFIKSDELTFCCSKINMVLRKDMK